MKRIIFLFIAILLPFVCQAAQFTIYEAGYPQHRDTNVRVENVTDVIHRRGVYMEHNIYIQFAYNFNSWFFKNYDELELEWVFDMPEQVLMHDLYYWEGDSVIQADIIDKWTAEQMFNEKTSPYREPVLFTRSKQDRNGQVVYNLRLFPVKRNTTQRIMIQYLVPATSTSGKIRSWLPINQLTMQNGGVNSLRILYYYEDVTEIPELIGKTGYSFAHFLLDSTREVTIPVQYGEYVEFVLPSPIKTDFYLTTCELDNETYYQLAVYPPETQQTHENRKILILVDYSITNSSGLTSELLLTSLKETMERSLTADDSIAIIIGFDEIVQSGPSWQACTPANFDNIFLKFFGRQFLQFNTSQEVLNRAVQYLNLNGPAEVLWITNRNDFPTETDAARDYATLLKSYFPFGITFHVLDLENKSSMISYMDYGYVAINFPFALELTQSTQGNLFFLRFHPLKTALAALFFEKVSHFDEVQVYAKMQTGYTFQQKLFSTFQGYYPLDFPVIQTGKIEGTFPMTVSVVGRINETQHKKDIIINQTDVIPGTSSLATAQKGQYLIDLAHQYQSNWLINDMVDLSIDARILTAYTAFLVPDVEKATFVYNFDDESKGGSRTDIEIDNTTTEKDSLLEFFATPNPFNPATTFQVYVPAKYAGGEISISIFNILGQQVTVLRQAAPVSGMYNVHFNALSDAQTSISSGTYFAVMQVKDMVKKLKLLYLK